MDKDFFINGVKNEFKYLENDFGFKYIIKNQGDVIYQNQKMFIKIIYDYHLSYSLELDFDKMIDSNEVPYALYHLLELKGDEDAELYKNGFVAEDDKDLLKKISMYADKLRKYMDCILTDEKIFEELLQIYNKEKKEYNTHIIGKKKKLF